MPRDNRNEARKVDKQQWQQLAFGGGGQKPPGGPTMSASNDRPFNPTLTYKFNAAAKKPVQKEAAKAPDYQKQIDLLRRQMSQPKHTFELTPLGSVTRSKNIEKDRRLLHTMAALTEKMNQQQSQTERFAKAMLKGLPTQQFNRAAKGMGR